MILDIKTYADTLLQSLHGDITELSGAPHLSIVMVGDNSASAVYVEKKIKTSDSIGIKTSLSKLPSSITQGELMSIIAELNHDPLVHGILVQSPLPDHICAQEVFDAIDPSKDVDGFSSMNISRLYCGDEIGLVPGTPKGIMAILSHYFHTSNERGLHKNQIETVHEGEMSARQGDVLGGKNAVIIGKSTIVGKPLAMLLLKAGVTVTICHSKTKDLALHTRAADIVICAVGKKHLITADMIQPESLVIDVGINVETRGSVRKLSGDCDTENIAKIADITPVPGGVGLMTIVSLLSNVVKAYRMQSK